MKSNSAKKSRTSKKVLILLILFSSVHLLSIFDLSIDEKDNTIKDTEKYYNDELVNSDNVILNNEEEKSTKNRDDVIISNKLINPSVLSSHAQIFIQNDTDFQTQASSEGWDDGGNRDGSKNNPFLIEDLLIEMAGPSGIVINNTSVYFTIRNTITNGSSSSTAAGIYLENTKNFIIENCVSKDNYVNILIKNATDFRISNVTLEGGNTYGISLVDVSDAIIQDSFFGLTGIFSKNVNNTIISNNEFDLMIFSSVLGILSNNLTIISNTITTLGDAINLQNCTNSLIHQNITILWDFRM